MYTETEGIVLRQTRTAGGRRMITLLTKRYGKISAGTSINEGGKTRSALALRPFSYGRYDIYRNRENYNINGAEAVQSFFAIGENMERYMSACYVLELADRFLIEDQPSSACFSLLLDYLSEIENRTSAFGTLNIAFQLKLLNIAGVSPVLGSCVRCGQEKEPALFSVSEGGTVCKDCLSQNDDLNPLCFRLSGSLVNALSYMEKHPLQDLKKLALDTELEANARKIMKAYISHHLGISNLRSEELII